MLLAGDIGGTKSRLAIFADDAGPRRPLLEEILPSGRFLGIEALIRAFLKRTNLTADRACFAIAGPVINGRAAVTNLPWIVEAETIRREFGFRSVRHLNDLAATARAVPLPDDLPKTERADEVAIAVDIKATAAAAAQAGMAALRGEKGATYDSLLLTASLILHHLGRAPSLHAAADQVRAALDSGRAAGRVK